MDLKDSYERLRKYKALRDEIDKLIASETELIRKTKTSKKLKKSLNTSTETNPNPGNQSTTRMQSAGKEDHATLNALSTTVIKEKKHISSSQPKNAIVQKDTAISYMDRINLALSIKNLPRNKLGRVVSILRSREISLVHDPDNIEIDLQKLKDSTILALIRCTCE